MPDQSSAATEHAIFQEITAPLANLPDDPVAVVANADFPVSLRGYDRLAVDAYVRQTSQLVAELQATRSPEAAVRRALERVGEQISGVLQRAHETGEQITTQSRREAEDRLEQSRAEAGEITAAAQQRVSDLDTDTDRIWAERRRIVGDARELARQLLALAESAAERFPPAAEIAPDDEQATTVRAPAAAGDRHRDDDVGQPEAGHGAEPMGEPSGGAPSGSAEDLDATIVLAPIDPDTDSAEDRREPDASAEHPSPPPAAGEDQRSSSVIRPASQAANRRFFR